jgi:hypothetical protein
MTDEELAAVVEKIIAAVRESIPKLRAEMSELVRCLPDDEWAKLKDDEDHRRAMAKGLSR